MRALTRAIAAFCLGAGALLWTGPPTSAAPGDPGEVVAVATHNIEHDGWQGLAWVAAHDRPLMLMGQEVCSPALMDLQLSIQGYGYGQFNIAQVKNSSISCGGWDLHTVAWTRYPQAVWNGGHHISSTTHGWACIRGATNGTTWRSCSTHMNPNEFPRAFVQSEDLRLNIIPPGSIASMVGGDFNLRPRGHDGHNTLPWRGSWDEGDDTCFAWGKDRRTLQPGDPPCALGGGIIRDVKIDQTWALGLQYYPTFGVGEIRCSVPSDHCLFYATYRWR